MAKAGSLPLKYRPEKFKELIGQDVNVRYLSELIRRGPIGKNIILYGPHGASKTTSCRIYARALNCLDSKEGEPCNECENCKLFFKNQFTDYVEVDGSSRGGVENIKELVEVAKSPPLVGKFRIINIDEAQGLSRQAWDRLLKLIEEPPSFLVFIFTTTEIDKVRDAIQSRCQKLEVKLINPVEGLKYLKKICELEKLIYEDQALNILNFMSKGHPRDIIKNLEQVTYLGDVNVENVKDIFNIGYIGNLVELFKVLFLKDVEDVIRCFRMWEEENFVIYELINEFFLFLEYRFVFNVGVVVNPVFDLVPEKDTEELWGRFSDIVEGLEIDREVAFCKLVEKFNTNVSSSKIGFEVFLINLHYFIFKENFGIKKLEENKKEEKIIRRRKFVGDYSKDSSILSEKEITFPVKEVEEGKEVEDKIYPHNLLAEGFEEPKNIRDITFDTAGEM